MTTSPGATPVVMGRDEETTKRIKRESISRDFTYLLNAMERAAQEENPSQHGYAEKRRAVMDFVASLAADLYPVGAA